MATLILTVLLGLLFSWFAVVNTQSVNINLANNLLSVPIFMLVIVSVLIGLLISAVISSIDWISSSFAMRSRESQIRQKEQDVHNLESKVHELEVENARLKRDEKGPVIIEKTHREEKPRSFFNKFRYHPTV